MRAFDMKPKIQNRMLIFEIGECPGIFENDLQLRAADHALAVDDQTRAWDRFGQALQTIPAGLRNFSELIRRIQNQIDNDQREISVA